MFFSIPLSLALLASMVTASPTPAPEPEIITIPLTRRDTPVTSDGIAQMGQLMHLSNITGNKYQRGAHAYHRNTGNQLPNWNPAQGFGPNSNLSFVKRQREGLTPQQGQALWTGYISVGTPAQNFIIDFDTGLALVAFCGDGSTSSGPVYKDTVYVAGLTATGQTLAMVTTESAEFKSGVQDGILGMGYQSLSNLRAPPFFQSLVAQKKVASSIFSFRLTTTGSELYLGGVNSAKYTGAITYTPVTQQAYWMVSGSVNIGSTVAAANQNLIIDTGTTTTANAAAFYAKISGCSAYGSSGYYTCPCTTLTSTSFSLTLGGRNFVIPAANMNLGKLSSTSTQCVSAIATGNIGINAWIIGDAFLKSVYSVYNLGTNQVGFATAV
ncbi:aspartic-type endopeptidase [Pseudohyphozyma bogoriensis]|nr:aspartic-type endopeptidase [Pseudohyphozyma bogoriensis]